MRAWFLLSRLMLWACLAGIGGTAIGQVYMWTDAQGKKHFGDAATRPWDKPSPELKVPPANVADRFVAPQTSDPDPLPPGTDEEASSSPDGSAVAPTLPHGPGSSARKLSGVDRSQDACRAQWAAYDAGVACYAECGKTACGGFMSCAQNNAECGHCQDAPRPRC